MREDNRERVDGSHMLRHRHVKLEHVLDQARRIVASGIEPDGRAIARIRRWRRWIARPFVLCGLDQDRLNVASGLSMPFEPRGHCTFSAIAHGLRRSLVIGRIEKTGEGLFGGTFGHDTKRHTPRKTAPAPCREKLGPHHARGSWNFQIIDKVAGKLCSGVKIHKGPSDDWA